MNAEIHELKTRTLELFASTADCQQQLGKHADQGYQRLVASRGLDPLTERRRKSIRTHTQYVASAIRDVDSHLDSQWQRYVNDKYGNK